MVKRTDQRTRYPMINRMLGKTARRPSVQRHQATLRRVQSRQMKKAKLGMSLDQLRTDYYERSAIASDVSRTLAISGIAVVWLFAFPKTEVFWLTDQIKRASISIPSNIAEWSARWTEKEQVHFLYIARGSASEVDTQLLIAKNLWFLSEEKYIEISEKLTIIGKMLTKLIQSLL